MPEDNVVEGSQDTPSEKYVSLTKYVGVKEMLVKREESLSQAQTSLTEAQTKTTGLETEVKNLGEQLTQAKLSVVDPERIRTLESERDTIKEELAQVKQATLLKEHKIKPEEIVGMSEDQIQAYIKGKGQAGKPGADLGEGAVAPPAGSGREKMKAVFDSLHPSDK